MILILAADDDVHARRVQQELSTIGAQSRILDLAHLGTKAAALSLRPAKRAVVRDPHGVVDLDAVTLVWRRRLNEPALSGMSEPTRSFVLREWRHAWTAMMETAPVVVNGPAQEALATKTAQLASAERCGLRTPETLITSDVDAAEDFIERHGGQVVHKASTAPSHRAVDTRAWLETQRQALRCSLPLSPIVLQELIRGRGDLRVTVAGDFVSAAFLAQGEVIDSRLNFLAEHVPYSLSGDDAAKMLAVIKNLGLVMATADFKVTHDNELVFFEVNPQGQFLYVEAETGQPLSAGVARALADLAAVDWHPVR